jgi:hypothetical protein
MPTATTNSTYWTCDRCAVTIRWMEGREPQGLPAGWSVDEQGAYCLSCRRSLAAEAACAEVDGTTREDRAKLRRQALIDFEIMRAPDRPNGEIAKAVSCSVPAVVKARKRLEQAAKVG